MWKRGCESAFFPFIAPFLVLLFKTLFPCKINWLSLNIWQPLRDFIWACAVLFRQRGKLSRYKHFIWNLLNLEVWKGHCSFLRGRSSVISLIPPPTRPFSTRASWVGWCHLPACPVSPPGEFFTQSTGKFCELWTVYNFWRVFHQTA